MRLTVVAEVSTSVLGYNAAATWHLPDSKFKGPNSKVEYDEKRGGAQRLGLRGNVPAEAATADRYDQRDGLPSVFTR